MASSPGCQGTQKRVITECQLPSVLKPSGTGVAGDGEDAGKGPGESALFILTFSIRFGIFTCENLSLGKYSLTFSI